MIEIKFIDKVRIWNILANEITKLIQGINYNLSDLTILTEPLKPNNNLAYFYKILEQNRARVIEIRKNPSIYDSLSNDWKRNFNLLNPLCSRFWKINISRKWNIIWFEGWLDQKWIIIVEIEWQIFSLIRYEDIVESVSNVPPFFHTNFRKFIIK